MRMTRRQQQNEDNIDNISVCCAVCNEKTENCCEVKGVQLPVCDKMTCLNEMHIDALIGKYSKKELRFANKISQLWFQHVDYTYHVIIQLFDDIKSGQKRERTEVFTNRLIRNQRDISNALSPYVGGQTTETLNKLLTVHIVIAAELVGDYIKDGPNSRSVNNTVAKWRQNAKAIAQELSEVKSKRFAARRFGKIPGVSMRVWKASVLETALLAHLTVTEDEIKAVTGPFTAGKSDWSAANNAHDRIIAQIQTISDAITLGVIKHFQVKSA